MYVLLIRLGATVVIHMLSGSGKTLYHVQKSSIYVVPIFDTLSVYVETFGAIF